MKRLQLSGGKPRFHDYKLIYSVSMITIDQFAQIEMKVGTITYAEKVEGTDKLLRLEIDLGSEKRQIVSGIAQYYNPQEIIGKQIPIITNLEPRKFKGIESQGMILAADDGKPVLLHPDKQITNGSILQ